MCLIKLFRVPLQCREVFICLVQQRFREKQQMHIIRNIKRKITSLDEMGAVNNLIIHSSLTHFLHLYTYYSLVSLSTPHKTGFTLRLQPLLMADSRLFLLSCSRPQVYNPHQSHCKSVLYLPSSNWLLVSEAAPIPSLVSYALIRTGRSSSVPRMRN